MKNVDYEMKPNLNNLVIFVGSIDSITTHNEPSASIHETGLKYSEQFLYPNGPKTSVVLNEIIEVGYPSWGIYLHGVVSTRFSFRLPNPQKYDRLVLKDKTLPN